MRIRKGTTLTHFPAPDDEQNFYNDDYDRSHHSSALSNSRSQRLLHPFAGILARMLQERGPSYSLITLITMVEGEYGVTTTMLGGGFWSDVWLLFR